ncbi:hypothetical protein Tco_0836842, partial [Tanacetum coccineum]
PSGELDGAPTLPDGRDMTKTVETNLVIILLAEHWDITPSGIPLRCDFGGVTEWYQSTRYRELGFAVVENIDSYNDEGLGDIIVKRPFCREARIKARRFDGMITIYKRNDSVTYQMA